MRSIVGTKGQIVISKEIRDQLGIKPGWKASQRLVDGRLEIRFWPPEHSRSLAGVLAKYVTTSISEEEWHDAKEKASEQAVLEDWMEFERQAEEFP